MPQEVLLRVRSYLYQGARGYHLLDCAPVRSMLAKTAYERIVLLHSTSETGWQSCASECVSMVRLARQHTHRRAGIQIVFGRARCIGNEPRRSSDLQK